ncbi:MAG: ABC transporter permease [Burkholderiales bacterium]|nr:ABC transporter permease [Burkholderiales bacterium]
MLLKLILKNALRHKLRTGLTLTGIVVAILAFGLLHTIVRAWYAGADATSSSRLVTRNAISLVFPMPLSYQPKLRAISGVAGVSYANWFGGVYITEKNFFPQFAVQADTYFKLYPEFLVDDAQMKDFLHDRKGALVGRKIAEMYGWKVGDVVPLRGTIWPGNWEFVIRGIYHGADQKTDQSQFFFHWDYLNETAKKNYPRRANTVGVYILALQDPARAAEISTAIDATFKNSLAETLTETEKAFQLSFVAMTETILTAVQAVSYVVILIIMAVMANTMAMTVRERLAEYATLKALGFSAGFVTRLIFGESVAIALIGAAIGIALTFPIAQAFGNAMGTLFPIFYVAQETVVMQVGAALIVGLVAAVAPSWRAATVNIVKGLRSVG